MLNESSEQAVAAAVWSRSAGEELLKERSHWRGVGRYGDDRVWRSIGRRTLREFRTLRRMLDLPPPELRSVNCLEWGPGGGSNLVALLPYCINYTGVDIAEANLDEANRQALEAGFDGFQPIHLVSSPHVEVRRLRHEVDLFVSTAVFQHFPSTEYGREVLSAVSRVMAPGGLGIVQIRFDNGNQKFASKDLSEYREHYLTATSFPIDEFWDLLSETGFVPEACRNIRTDVNYVTYLFQKPAD